MPDSAHPGQTAGCRESAALSRHGKCGGPPVCCSGVFPSQRNPVACRCSAYAASSSDERASTAHSGDRIVARWCSYRWAALAGSIGTSMRTAASKVPTSSRFSSAAGLPVKIEFAYLRIASWHPWRPLSTGEGSPVGVGSPSVAWPIAARFLRRVAKLRGRGSWSMACRRPFTRSFPERSC